MTRHLDADRDGPAGAPAPWRAVEIFAVPAGWAVAAVALWPAVADAETGARAAPVLVLGAVVAWWATVVAIVRSDLRDFVIPDGASLTVAVLGLAVAVGPPLLAGDAASDALLAGGAALATGAAGFAVFRLVGLAFRRFGRDALGFGDVKLAGACSVWLLPGDAALALEIAALGAVAALLLTHRDGALRDTAVPFGAFLAPAAWLVFVLGPMLRGAGVSPW